jgi:hypothetical protein
MRAPRAGVATRPSRSLVTKSPLLDACAPVWTSCFKARHQVRLAEVSGIAPDTGGAIAFLSPELLFSPLADLVLFGTVRIPIIERFGGEYTAGRIWMAGLVRDF